MGFIKRLIRTTFKGMLLGAGGITPRHRGKLNFQHVRKIAPLKPTKFHTRGDKKIRTPSCNEVRQWARQDSNLGPRDYELTVHLNGPPISRSHPGCTNSQSYQRCRRPPGQHTLARSKPA
jgi:hypothetical protein